MRLEERNRKSRANPEIFGSSVFLSLSLEQALRLHRLAVPHERLQIILFSLLFHQLVHFLSNATLDLL